LLIHLKEVLPGLQICRAEILSQHQRTQLWSHPRWLLPAGGWT